MAYVPEDIGTATSGVPVAALSVSSALFLGVSGTTDPSLLGVGITTAIVYVPSSYRSHTVTIGAWPVPKEKKKSTSSPGCRIIGWEGSQLLLAEYGTLSQGNPLIQTWNCPAIGVAENCSICVVAM